MCKEMWSKGQQHACRRALCVPMKSVQYDSLICITLIDMCTSMHSRVCHDSCVGPRTATHCNTLQHNATHCNTLQHTTHDACSSRLEPTSERAEIRKHITQSPTHGNTLQHTATHHNTLQHTTTHCNTLQLTATHHNTLQHTATHCNTPPTNSVRAAMPVFTVHTNWTNRMCVLCQEQNP